jgi:hypothetical protein
LNKDKGEDRQAEHGSRGTTEEESAKQSARDPTPEIDDTHCSGDGDVDVLHPSAKDDLPDNVEGQEANEDEDSADEGGIAVEVEEDDEEEAATPESAIGEGMQTEEMQLVSPADSTGTKQIVHPETPQSDGASTVATTAPFSTPRHPSLVGAQDTPGSARADSGDDMTEQIAQQLEYLQRELQHRKPDGDSAGLEEESARDLGNIQEEAGNGEEASAVLGESVSAADEPTKEAVATATAGGGSPAARDGREVPSPPCASRRSPVNTANGKSAKAVGKVAAKTTKAVVVLTTGISTADNKPLWRKFKKLAGDHGGRVVSEYERDVTHIVTPTNADGFCTKRTLKFMQGVADGKWVVGPKWVQACVDADATADETPFEVKGYTDLENGRLRLSLTFFEIRFGLDWAQLLRRR